MIPMGFLAEIAPGRSIMPLAKGLPKPGAAQASMMKAVSDLKQFFIREIVGLQ